MPSARVTENIIKPYFHPMREDIILNAMASMGALSCALHFTINSYLIYSDAVKSDSNGIQKYINAVVDANAFYRMFGCTCVRECSHVARLRIWRSVLVSMLRAVTKTTWITLCNGAEDFSSIAS